MKLKVYAVDLRPGDIVGSGETIISVSADVRTPAGKVEICLRKGERNRMAEWGKFTKINITRAIDALK